MYLLMGFFFFQAEDGIRDLVRSRGLGDVYKRQRVCFRWWRSSPPATHAPAAPAQCAPVRRAASAKPVSYTHLTLPTSDLV